MALRLVVRDKRHELSWFVCRGWEVVEGSARRCTVTLIDDPEQTLTVTAYGTSTDRIFKANKAAGRAPEQTRYATLPYLGPVAARRKAELSR
ncbi:hypothetical protein ACQPYK_43285 [Streptosporangium sp. CA-135522]|uniref:hypothetical protein n=1 Tax=Streptosporangium sp. CA-135522 TaxID=3240072 RepID=UPI003D8D4A17